MPRRKSGTFDQSKYIQQYIKEKVTVKKVTFNKEADADLLGWLDGKKFSTYVKELIREDMQVVRCKDCKKQGSYDCHITSLTGQTSSDDWYCADGERK